jgi:hypothetical protein
LALKTDPHLEKNCEEEVGFFIPGLEVGDSEGHLQNTLVVQLLLSTLGLLFIGVVGKTELFGNADERVSGILRGCTCALLSTSVDPIL